MKIKLGRMRWSNAFSYGADNEIDFSSAQLTQLLGKNGYGKTSIAMILEEVLFNKNSKGIKKGSILNRYTDSKFYTIELEFTAGEDQYVISTKRGSTQTVKLEKNGVDISSHTATATYKQIESILQGFDHKAFTQIVSQSSASSLEFLTATDSNRKKFLIDLLNLTRYTEAGERFKELSKDVDGKIQVVKGKLSTVNSWIDKNKNIDLTEKPILEVPTLLVSEPIRINELKAQLTTLAEHNKQVVQNNKYKEILDSIKIKSSVRPKPEDRTAELNSKKATSMAIKLGADTVISKFSKLKGCCPTCDQEIDTQKVSSLLAEANDNALQASARILILDRALKAEQLLLEEWKANAALVEKFEQYHALYRPDLSSELLDEASINREIRSLSDLVSKNQADISAINNENTRAAAHNAKIQVLREQLASFQEDAEVLCVEADKLYQQKALLDTLVKAFSTSGLVAYKIECLVKDLEDLTNGYLADLSGGRFQLGFQISGSDKLNVVMTDNGRDVEITELSNGERTRVNLAALLGIRKLLQSISDNQINLLFLDETIENLDVDGKEKLVEVLLSEEHLNTVLVSHGFQHPLLEKVQVIKENNISRIE
jgi:DNA repair exonuclease SbcCD ATPase subunit